MIGTIFGLNKKIDIFLSPIEIDNLENKTLEGTYVNARENILGKLTLGLKGKEIGDRGKYILDKDESLIIKNLEIFIRDSEYPKIKSNNLGLHLGYAHIHTHNIEDLKFNDKIYYLSLKAIEKRLQIK